MQPFTSRIAFETVASERFQHSLAAMDIPPALAPIVASQLLALAGLSLLLERAPASSKNEAVTAKTKNGCTRMTHPDSTERTRNLDALLSSTFASACRWVKRPISR